MSLLCSLCLPRVLPPPHANNYSSLVSRSHRRPCRPFDWSIRSYPRIIAAFTRIPSIHQSRCNLRVEHMCPFPIPTAKQPLISAVRTTGHSFVYTLLPIHMYAIQPADPHSAWQHFMDAFPNPASVAASDSMMYSAQSAEAQRPVPVNGRSIGSCLACECCRCDARLRSCQCGSAPRILFTLPGRLPMLSQQRPCWESLQATPLRPSNASKVHSGCIPPYYCCRGRSRQLQASQEA